MHASVDVIFIIGASLLFVVGVIVVMLLSSSTGKKKYSRKDGQTKYKDKKTSTAKKSKKPEPQTKAISKQIAKATKRAKDIGEEEEEKVKAKPTTKPKQHVTSNATTKVTDSERRKNQTQDKPAVVEEAPASSSKKKNHKKRTTKKERSHKLGHSQEDIDFALELHSKITNPGKRGDTTDEGKEGEEASSLTMIDIGGWLLNENKQKELDSYRRKLNASETARAELKSIIDEQRRIIDETKLEMSKLKREKQTLEKQKLELETKLETRRLNLEAGGETGLDDDPLKGKDYVVAMAKQRAIEAEKMNETLKQRIKENQIDSDNSKAKIAQLLGQVEGLRAQLEVQNCAEQKTMAMDARAEENLHQACGGGQAEGVSPPSEENGS